MKVTKREIDTHTLELTIVAMADELSSIKTETVRSLQTADLKIPGFRAGKAPLPLVEKQLDQQLLQESFINRALNSLYSRALVAEQIRALGDPRDITMLKFVPFSELEFKLTVPVLGKISLPDYKKMKSEPPKITVTAKDVNGVLTSLQKQAATKKPSTKAAQEGDEVIIDFRGTDKSKKDIPGADGKDYPLILGSKTFIPGFEEKVISHKPGETFSFTVSFPKDYGVSSLQGKPVTFEVTIKQINALELPKLDDSLAKKVGPFKSLDDLKADIKKQLQYERQQEAESNYKQQLLQDIAAKAKVDIPKELVDSQIEINEKEERQNLAYRGETWEEHLKSEGVTEEQHRERNRPQAAEQVKAGLVLAEISQKEDIVVTREEVEIRIQLLKGQYKDQAMQAELDSEEARSNIGNRLITEKTLQKLADYASAK